MEMLEMIPEEKTTIDHDKKKIRITQSANINIHEMYKGVHCGFELK